MNPNCPAALARTLLKMAVIIALRTPRASSDIAARPVERVSPTPHSPPLTGKNVGVSIARLKWILPVARLNAGSRSSMAVRGIRWPAKSPFSPNGRRRKPRLGSPHKRRLPSCNGMSSSRLSTHGSNPCQWR